MNETPEQESAREQLRQAILSNVKAFNWGNGFLTDVVVCVAWQPDQPGHVRYGNFFIEDMAHHRVIGLLETLKNCIVEDSDAEG